MSDLSDLATRLQAHLDQVQADPSIALDERLFKQAEVFLVVQLRDDPTQSIGLITALSSVLQTLQQDPAPVISLLTKLVEPYSFSDILGLQPPVDFVAGLSLAAVPFNSLVLQLLAKASQSSKDVAILANMPAIVQALVNLLLCTQDVGVADKAANVIVELLAVDKEATDVSSHGVGADSTLKAGGQGLLWRRVFGDKDVYNLFCSICSLNHEGPADIGKREKTVAQARLLTLIPRLGQMDWHTIARSRHPEIEQAYGLKSDEGLLDFVSQYMVDTKDDVLIHMNLLEFFSNLITMIREPSPTNSTVSVSLAYLLESNLHSRAISFWLNPTDPSHDPIDIRFLYGPSAHYLAIYASTYPSAFLSSSECQNVITRLSEALSISANQWAHGESPKHDLNVLTSLPRVALLPQRRLGTGRQLSPLLLVPSKITNADALNALAVILHGPSKPRAEDLTYGVNGFSASDTAESQYDKGEAAAAYALYVTYIRYHETLIADLITHADTVALPEKALAAINLLAALASANYAPLPSDDTSSSVASFDHSSGTPSQRPTPTPTPTQLATLLTLSSPTHLPTFSASPLLTSTAGRDKLLPWLCRPPQTFSNLVGGRGDAESSAYKIATARFDLVLIAQKAVESLVSSSGGGDDGDAGNDEVIWMVEALTARVKEGVWGVREGGVAGSVVATLEL